jgi:4-hydroxy-2-oxoheptanedioate aldolase
LNQLNQYSLQIGQCSFRNFLHCTIVLGNNRNMKNISIKEQLESGARLNGCWLEMFNPVASEIVAMGGYDVAMIDLEHSPASFTDAISMMQAVSSHGCAPVIRASSSDSVDIKRVLDIGPSGMMVPNVKNADEARQMVGSCRYGPGGDRGAAPGIIRATGYGTDVAAYLEFMASRFLLIAQIECKEAVEEIELIAAVEGIDMLFVGPSDLSASLGAIGQYDSTAFTTAFQRIEQQTLAAGKLLGTIPFPGYNARRLYQAGHSLVVSGTDTILLKKAAAEDANATREASLQV